MGGKVNQLWAGCMWIYNCIPRYVFHSVITCVRVCLLGHACLGGGGGGVVMADWQIFVIAQISIGPCMPASVVYSHNGTGDTRHTPKPRLSTFVLTERERKMDEGTDRRTCSRHARSQEEGLCLLWCLRWTKSASEAQKLPLPPPPLPPALKILIHHSTVAPWLLWSLSVTLTALPTTMHAFFAVLQTQLRNNYKAEGLRYVYTI